MQVTPGPGLFIDEFAKLSTELGRPISWTALLTGAFGKGTAPKLVERTAELGGEVWPQISCRPLVMQATMADPFPFAVVPAFEEVLGGELAAAHVVDHDVGDARVADVDHDDREAVALDRRDLVVEQRQRDHEQPVDAIEAGEVAEGPGALLRRLDVEEHQPVPVVAGAPGHTPQTLDHGRRREERRDDPDRLRAPERQAARGRARAVAELGDRLAHAVAHLVAHDRDVVEHAGHRRDAHTRVTGDVADRRLPTRLRAHFLLHGVETNRPFVTGP